MALILITVAVMAGIVAADGREVAPLTLAALGLPALLLWAPLGRRWRRLGLIVGLTGAGLLGAARIAAALPETTDASIWLRAGQYVELRGTVDGEPRWSEGGQRVVVSVDAVQVGDGAGPADGLVQAELPAEPALLPGSQVVLAGTLVRPRSGATFNYAAYLGRRDIFVILDTPRLLQSADPPPGILTTLLRIKGAAFDATLRILPEPEAGLLAGILLGMQGALAPDTRAEFSLTGTSHILVISGWNISITVAGALWVAGRAGLRRWPAVVLALGAVVLYVLLVGPSAAVVRSAIMGALVALAGPLGRRSDAWTTLAAACLGMCLLDPHVLWDLGFQLSAGAVAGLFACGSAAVERTKKLLPWKWCAWAVEPLAATFAAQVWTLPLLMAQFGSVSLIAPLANVALVPVVPLAMAGGALAVLAGMASTTLALPLAFLAWLPLTWLTRGAALLAALPYASVPVPPIPPWLLGGYYVVSIWWASRIRHE